VAARLREPTLTRKCGKWWPYRLLGKGQFPIIGLNVRFFGVKQIWKVPCEPKIDSENLRCDLGQIGQALLLSHVAQMLLPYTTCVANKASMRFCHSRETRLGRGHLPTSVHWNPLELFDEEEPVKANECHPLSARRNLFSLRSEERCRVRRTKPKRQATRQRGWGPSAPKPPPK